MLNGNAEKSLSELSFNLFLRANGNDQIKLQKANSFEIIRILLHQIANYAFSGFVGYLWII